MFDGPEPIYLQIAAYIRDLIRAGALQDGDQVMSTTQFSTTYRINPATVAKGFAELVEEQLVEKRRGLGMFVAQGAGEHLRSTERSTFFSADLTPVVTKAEQLGITRDEIIAYLRSLP